MIILTDTQRKLIRQALGLVNRKSSYRNFFVADSAHYCRANWEEMVKEGKAVLIGVNNNDVFRVSISAATAALEPGEWLDPNNFTTLKVDVVPLKEKDTIRWRCFHCNETFTKDQEEHARDHFGRVPNDVPVCLIKEPGEYSLLRVLRILEHQIAMYRAEDTDLLRAMCSMAADHRVLLVEQEQIGYDRGLRDGRVLSAAAIP